MLADADPTAVFRLAFYTACKYTRDRFGIDYESVCDTIYICSQVHGEARVIQKKSSKVLVPDKIWSKRVKQKEDLVPPNSDKLAIVLQIKDGVKTVIGYWSPKKEKFVWEEPPYPYLG